LTHRFDLPVDVIRLLLPGDAAAAGHPVIMDVNPRWEHGADLAAQRANLCDVVLVNVDRHIPLSLMGAFIARLTCPVVLTIDEIPTMGEPDLATLRALAGKGAVAVVPSETAKRRLHDQLDRSFRIEVIPHGSPWKAFPPRPEPRRRLLTWGFIGPGMGAERVIRALPLLDDLDPLPRYRLIGVTDPVWTRAEASGYREALTAEAQSLGVSDRFEMIPMLHSKERLASEIERSDLIVVTYDSPDRAGSRILTEAVSTGRPVVSTAFPAAIELLGSGPGTTVAHDSPEDMANAIRGYLTDDRSYRRAASLSAALSPRLSWEETARDYASLIGDLLGSSVLVNGNRS
jgi:glycosyltransferase involved in cell wall biosynthesis